MKNTLADETLQYCNACTVS